jgi:class 3 adenylate cyclase/predicted ATPase
MLCSQCQEDNPRNARFCMHCAAPLLRRCTNCNADVPPEARFCPQCAHPVEPTSAQPPTPTREPLSYTPKHLAEKILTSRSALEGERKTITALFADIKGSMELLEDLDPEEARRVIDPALQLMMDAVHRYEGYVAQSTGDGIFALFGAPIAHEDHPQRALYAALLMQESIRRYTEKLRLEKGITIQVRVGVNTGEVVVRSIRKDDLHADYAPVGHSTSLAARMEGMAAPGTIVVSEHTHKLTEGYFQFKPLGPANVKGVSEPIQVYEVSGVGPLKTKLQVAVRRGLVRFVGRSAELEQMRRAWESTKASRGQIVAVMGEAGVGKSRLVYEFKVPLESQCLVLEAFSISHGKAHAYLPLIELLKTYFEIMLGDDERKRRERVAGKVIMLDRTLEDTLPYLFALLGVDEATSPLLQMDPQIRRQRTLDAIKRLLVRESLNQPLILIFEDLHWIDGETQAFLEVLADSVATAKILLLVNYRPQYQHGWASKTYYTRLRLDPLGKEEAQELLTALVGDGPQAGLQPLKQLVMEKTEGNPFFMEELVQTLAEEGVLAGERGRYRVEKAVTELHIPTTVQGVLAARIDRLPADEKETLQTLSVIGKELPLALLRRVTGHSEDELYRLLSRLQAGEFIYEQPAFPEPEYTFKHALTQEVSYQSLLRERRKVLHEQTARAIEELYQYGLDEHYNELAHHYGRAENTSRAVEYLHLVGQQAVKCFAFGEAITQITKGLELLNTLPETPQRNQQELLLQIALGGAWIVGKGGTAPEVENAYIRARQLCQGAEETPHLFNVLELGLWFYLSRADLYKARELGEQLLSLAQRQQDSGLLSLAHGLLGYVLVWSGELSQAREHQQKAIAFYDSQRHRGHAFFVGYDPGVSSLSPGAMVLLNLGYPDQALKKSREGLILAQELATPVCLADALMWASGAHLLIGEAQAGQDRAEELMAFSNEKGLADYLATGMLLRGCALAEQGQTEEGIEQMRQVSEAMRATGMELAMPWALGMLAEAYGKAEQPQEGLAVIPEAVDVMNKTGQRLFEPYLYRVKGELLLAVSEDNHPEAQFCFREAIDVARRQSAKSLELRAATSLARLWQKQGKKEEARQLLAEIYGWFTEGFDTRDLKEARALLEELS